MAIFLCQNSDNYILLSTASVADPLHNNSGRVPRVSILNNFFMAGRMNCNSDDYIWLSISSMEGRWNDNFDEYSY